MSKDNYNGQTNKSDRQRNINTYRARQAAKNPPKPQIHGGKSK
jgi:hypothetical protein